MKEKRMGGGKKKEKIRMDRHSRRLVSIISFLSPLFFFFLFLPLLKSRRAKKPKKSKKHYATHLKRGAYPLNSIRSVRSLALLIRSVSLSNQLLPPLACKILPFRMVIRMVIIVLFTISRVKGRIGVPDLRSLTNREFSLRISRGPGAILPFSNQNAENCSRGKFEERRASDTTISAISMELRSNFRLQLPPIVSPLFPRYGAGCEETRERRAGRRKERRK